jgi:hypothetical protein
MVKGWKNIFQENGPSKQAGVAILISAREDLKPKLARRDKEGHFKLIRGTIYQESIKMLTYAKC